MKYWLVEKREEVTEDSIETDESQSPSSDADWPKRAADAVETLAELIRGKAIRPLLMVAKAITYGFLALGLASIFAVLMISMLVRLITVYLTGNHVWITYLALGGIFTLLGMFTWSRRSSKVTG